MAWANLGQYGLGTAKVLFVVSLSQSVKLIEDYLAHA